MSMPLIPIAVAAPSPWLPYCTVRPGTRTTCDPGARTPSCDPAPTAYAGSDGDTTARQDRARGVGRRDGDVADLRRQGSRPGPARDRCRARPRRHLLRFVAD